MSEQEENPRMSRTCIYTPTESRSINIQYAMKLKFSGELSPSVASLVGWECYFNRAYPERQAVERFYLLKCVHHDGSECATDRRINIHLRTPAADVEQIAIHQHFIMNGRAKPSAEGTQKFRNILRACA